MLVHIIWKPNHQNHNCIYESLYIILCTCSHNRGRYGYRVKESESLCDNSTDTSILTHSQIFSFLSILHSKILTIHE